MATVKLLQSTFMEYLETDHFGETYYPTATSIDLVNTLNSRGGYVFMSGTFTRVPDSVYPPWQGTISGVLFDTLDPGYSPNLEITDLSFELSNAYFNNVILYATRPNFIRDLLAGDDTIVGADRSGLRGYGGNDTLIGSSSYDVLEGGDGNDTLIPNGGPDHLTGGAGSDTVSYASASAGLFAGLEDRQHNTGDATHQYYSSIENLYGSAFNDILYGDDAVNILRGGAGNDRMVGKGGADRFNGGAGNDTVVYDASFPYTANFAIRADLLSPATNTGDAAGDVYSSIENLDGSSFDDVLAGNNDPNILRGNGYPGLSGNDQLFGRGGNDTLSGNDQDDRLIGGTGLDMMTGGNGADVFDFNAVEETGGTAATRDRIIDFTHLTDDIDLSTIDANGGAAGNTAFGLLASDGAAFTGVRGQLRWFREDLAGTANDRTIIAGDINGDAVADFQIELAGLKTLTAPDFVL